MGGLKEGLKLENLVVKYGSIAALHGISLEVHKGEIVTLIGANGAGKTTTMYAITKIIPIAFGKIYYEGQDVTRTSTRKMVKKGLVLSPEGRQIFPKFTVYENLMLGSYLVPNTAEGNLRRVTELFPVLKSRMNQKGGTLSGGEQQMLAIARAMMSQPKFLLLDEPSLGLAPLVVADVFALIQRIRSMGVTVLLVEQNARMALRISDRAYVLESGNIVMSGNAKELASSKAVISAYLGG